MRKIHLDQCLSTQDYLLDKIREGNPFDLVSTELQTSGRGRHENKWIQLEHTLCFSFICEPNEVLTLTSAEISTIICNFFKENYKHALFMKWPNDILNSKGEKCGGLIINNLDKKSVVGVGLNLFPGKNDQLPNSDYPVGHIFQNEIKYSRKEMSEKIVNYILNNRLTPVAMERNWESLCFHQSKEVTIIDSNFHISGIFVGLGKNGEALIQKGPEIFKIYNGHLRINN